MGINFDDLKPKRLKTNSVTSRSLLSKLTRSDIRSMAKKMAENGFDRGLTNNVDEFLSDMVDRIEGAFKRLRK